ncbi:MAG: 50S ribosomal protein L3 [Planctomycetales bacterium]|nr:50S ribosomal protein L3 [Planctomycetales bacterium]
MAVPVAILGRKVGMTQVFSPDGRVTPVTAIEAGPCVVGQVKIRERDGYTAVQMGFGTKKKSRARKPEVGHWKKVNVEPPRFVRELRLPAEDLKPYTPGQQVQPDIFKVGDFVDVIGTSKGRGYQGVVRKYGHHGHPHSHGTHEYERHPGAIGCEADPGRVIKGMKLPGHMGDVRVTVRNLEVMRVALPENLLYVKGAVPGAPNAYLYVRTARTRKPRPPEPPKPAAEKADKGAKPATKPAAKPAEKKPAAKA